MHIPFIPIIFISSIRALDKVASVRCRSGKDSKYAITLFCCLADKFKIAGGGTLNQPKGVVVLRRILLDKRGIGRVHTYVEIAVCRFDADIARHFGKHCRLVSYFMGNSCLLLYYTPEGEINTQRTNESVVPQSEHVFSVYFKVKSAAEK